MTDPFKGSERVKTAAPRDCGPVKICGIRDERALAAVADGGADWIGLVFFPPSPRALTAEAAMPLAERARRLGLKAVGVFVDPDDALLARTAPFLDLVQLHGRESPARVAAIRQRWQRPVIKAIAVAEGRDLMVVPDYAAVADHLLFDTKAPPDAVLPGGRGERFDWRLLQEVPASLRARSLLSGGLDPDNVGAALALLPGFGVDVSSGVEDKPGEKNPERMAAFLAAVRKARKGSMR
ncbi:MAG: phosphoribosylanthranilate isomerase [Alphaproteobacteria bacterium]|nr:MAG: phosphoribosylanthranilate isomerase [Alphaproteobacteria bacterium]